MKHRRLLASTEKGKQSVCLRPCLGRCDTWTLQQFASDHANVHNHFNRERRLTDRQTYKTRRSG